MKRLSFALAALSLSALARPATAQSWDQGVVVDGPNAVLPHRQRVRAVNAMLRNRLEEVLPTIMRQTGIDLWLIINREYNEDPVYLTLVPEPVFAARRTTMLVLHDRGEEAGVERLTVSRYAIPGFYETAWGGGSDEEQWQALAALLRERAPEKVGINLSEHWAFGDGLSAGLHFKLMEAAPDVTFVSAEALCVRWLESRTEMELQLYPQIVRLARQVIGEAFSNRVITPGATTVEDVGWYIRDRFAALDLPIWFQPYVNVQRRDSPQPKERDFYGLSRGVIERGDILHTDVGIDYLRLCTDTQEMGYVLRLGEEDVPDGLKRAMAVGNRWQDHLTASFAEGLTGNQILAEARRRSEAEGILGTVYTHPLGFHGHAAGPTIGMWDNQGPTPIRGDWPLYANTCFSIEGNVKVQVPEWDDEWVQIKLEQDAVFDGETVTYLAGRQTQWHVVR